MDPVFARNPALEEAALADAAARDVYADWLIDQGSPWGHLLAAERAGQVDEALRRRCEEPLHALFASIEKPVGLTTPLTGISWASFQGSEPLYELLLRLPCIAFADALWLGDGPYRNWNQILHLVYDMTSIEAHGLPRGITKLWFDLSTLFNHNGDMGPQEPPALGPISSQLGEIRELSLPYCDDFSQLTELRLEGLAIYAGYTSENLRSVADLPATLRSLSLSTLYFDGVESDLTHADQKAFFQADLSHLRQLSLEPCDLPAGGSPLELLLSSRWLETLETLRMTYQHIDVRKELTILQAEARAITHLRKFELVHEASEGRIVLESFSEAALISAARRLDEDPHFIAECEAIEDD
jgi:hypothetical protein